ncbi:hypothetical protein FRC11_014200, partial [Ceratobasidium sp. 423]
MAPLGRSKSIDDAKAGVETIVAIIKEEQSRLTNISVNIPAEAQLQTSDIIIKVFIELVPACVKLSPKSGAPPATNFLAEADAASPGYLLALTDCVPGLIQILNNLAVNLNGEVISDIRVVDMVRCVKLLGLASKIPGVVNSSP